MPDEYPNPIFLDATVISNFASTDSIEFLASVSKAPVVVPAVRDEIERGQDFGHDYLAAAVEAFGETLQPGDVPPETGTISLRDRLDPGEAEALRSAVEHDGTLATDDLAARRLTDDLNVPVTGSIGFLTLGVERGRIDSETADGWFDVWRDVRGYYAPVESVAELLGNNGGSGEKSERD
jgi:predicted nucleic acid-binding protein